MVVEKLLTLNNNDVFLCSLFGPSTTKTAHKPTYQIQYSKNKKKVVTARLPTVVFCAHFTYLGSAINKYSSSSLLRVTVPPCVCPVLVAEEGSAEVQVMGQLPIIALTELL